MAQYFYALPDNEALIRGYVLQAGFREDRSPLKGYVANNSFLQIQKIKSIKGHIARESGLEIGFVLDLELEKEEYGISHPVSKLLRLCEKAKVFDISGQIIKHIL